MRKSSSPFSVGQNENYKELRSSCRSISLNISKEKQFSCGICSLSYSSKQALSGHIRTKHSLKILTKTEKKFETNQNSFDRIHCNDNEMISSSNLNFLKLRRYEDYLDLLKKSERCIPIKDYFDPNYDSLVDQIIEEAFKELYSNQIKIHHNIQKRKKRRQDSQDWSTSLKNLLITTISNPSNFSILSYISHAYIYVLSSDSINFFRTLKSYKLKQEGSEIKKIVSTYTIDDVLSLFFIFNKQLLNQYYLFFLLKIVCTLREFINLKYFLLYEKHNYTENFSAEALPTIALDFFLNIIDLKDWVGIIKDQAEHTIFTNHSDLDQIDKILRLEKKPIFFKLTNLATNLTSIIKDYNKFLEMTKPRIRSTGRKSAYSLSVDSSKMNNKSNKTENSIYNQIRAHLSTRDSFKVRDTKEIFFMLDYLCLWINKNGYSPKLFCKEDCED